MQAYLYSLVYYYTQLGWPAEPKSEQIRPLECRPRQKSAFTRFGETFPYCLNCSFPVFGNPGAHARLLVVCAAVSRLKTQKSKIAPSTSPTPFGHRSIIGSLSSIGPPSAVCALPFAISALGSSKFRSSKFRVQSSGPLVISLSSLSSLRLKVFAPWPLPASRLSSQVRLSGFSPCGD